MRSDRTFDRNTLARYRGRRSALAFAALVAVIPLSTLPISPARAQAAPVAIVNFSFDPNPVTIPVGGTVTWVNGDTAPHTATEDHNAWSSPVLNNGDSYSHTFTQAGTITYYCVIHSNMHGTIIVGGPPTPIAQPSATPRPFPTQQPTVIPTAPGGVTLTPVPTITPLQAPTTPPYPAASRLYGSSVKALHGARGCRISETALRTSRGKQQRFSLVGDVAPRSQAERLTLNVGNGSGQRTDILQVAGRAWTKRSVDREWKQVKVSRLNSMLTPLRNPLQGQAGVIVSNLTTVGPGTLGGVPVWHIRWTETRGSLVGTADSLIARRNFLPLQVVTSLDDRSTNARVVDRLVRSRFGEKRSIKPPKY